MQLLCGMNYTFRLHTGRECSLFADFSTVCVCVCVLGLGYIKKEEHIHKHRSGGGSCQRHCAQLPRHQNRPNPNATETNTPVYLQVAEYKLITCYLFSGN